MSPIAASKACNACYDKGKTAAVLLQHWTFFEETTKHSHSTRSVHMRAKAILRKSAVQDVVVG